MLDGNVCLFKDSLSNLTSFENPDNIFWHYFDELIILKFAFESKNVLLFQSSSMYQSDTVMSRALAWKYSR